MRVLSKWSFGHRALAAAVFTLAGVTASCNGILGNDDPTLRADGGESSARAGDATTGGTAGSTRDVDATMDADGAVVTSTDGAPVDATADASDTDTDDSGDDDDDDDDGSFADAPGCPTGQTLCSGSCVSTADPDYGCGASSCQPCDIARGTAGCSGGACSVASCMAGYADCDSNPANGCETDLSVAAHCGTCNSMCTSVAPACTPINGTFECVVSCPVQAPTICDNSCVNLTTSPTNCGQCGKVCPGVTDGTSTCVGSVCGFACNSPYHQCGNVCVAPNDPSACGASCTACPTPANANPDCNGGTCGFTCTKGYANCDNNAANGCETMAKNGRCPK